jgi:uncharacterized protein with PIN domain
VDCLLAKIHRSPTSKEITPRSTVPGEKIFIDISKFTHTSIVGSKYWLLVVDDATNYTWSFFLKQKSNTTQRLMKFIQLMKNRGTPIKKIRCDNSENNDLQRTTQETGMDIKFQYTAPGTPQQNGHVERKFAILYEYMRTMINQSKILESIQKKIGAEAAHHSTDAINCICTPNNKIPPYKAFYGENPTYFKHLRPFGQLAVTLDVHTKLKGKTKNRRLLGLYVGRAVDHSPETCRLFKLDTQRIIITRDVRFTNQMYADYFADTEISSNRYTILQDEDDDEDELNHLTDDYPTRPPANGFLI